MIDVTKCQPTVYDEDKQRTHIHREGTCLSTDTKPTDREGGSVLMEIGTSKVYIYDQAGGIWREWT